jgi:uncharacterized protein involved in exopolysaccharide biosynthesis
LQRAVTTARDHYEQVQRRQFSAATLETLPASGGTGRIVVVDPPLLPERPSARGPRTVAALGFGGVVFIGMAIAFLLTLIDDRVYDGYDIRRLKLGPIAQLVPPFDTKKV